MKGFNNKTWVFGVITTVLLIAIIMPSTPIASSQTIDWCETVMSGMNCVLCSDIPMGFHITEGTFSNILVVPSLNDCSLIKDVVVTGNIQVENDAEFSTNGITILGNIISDGADRISISGININGNIQIENSNVDSVVTILNSEIGGNVLFNNNIVLRDVFFNKNTINGNVEFNENTSKRGSIHMNDNDINGNVEFNENTVDPRRQWNNIGDNDVNGNLDCVNNNKLKIEPNTVNGNMLGQCA